MFIMDWETFNGYSSFLFPYLEEVERRLMPHPYSRLQRKIGYIAEAMIGLWVEYTKPRVKYVSYTDYNTSNYKSGIRTSLRNFQRDIGFNLLYLPHNQKIYYYSAVENALNNQGISIQKL